MCENPENHAKIVTHRLIYSLVYPAFLGAFIYSILINFDLSLEWRQWWAILFAFYFATQFLHASADKEVEWKKAPFDILEIAFMVWVFAELGYFEHTASDDGDWCTIIAMVAAIATPPLARSIAGDMSRHKLLTLASVIAAVTIVVDRWFDPQPSWFAFFILLVVLVAYAKCWVFKGR